MWLCRPVIPSDTQRAAGAWVCLAHRPSFFLLGRIRLRRRGLLCRREEGGPTPCRLGSRHSWQPGAREDAALQAAWSRGWDPERNLRLGSPPWPRPGLPGAAAEPCPDGCSVLRCYWACGSAWSCTVRAPDPRDAAIPRDLPGRTCYLRPALHAVPEGGR